MEPYRSTRPFPYAGTDNQLLDPGVIDYIEGDHTVWERGPLERLAGAGQLVAFRHTRFWKPIDTLRDKRELETLWASGFPPWKRW
jgi:glucose-1-phosphate cytidylyltransferase